MYAYMIMSCIHEHVYVKFERRGISREIFDFHVIYVRSYATFLRYVFSRCFSSPRPVVLFFLFFRKCHHRRAYDDRIHN